MSSIVGSNIFQFLKEYIFTHAVGAPKCRVYFKCLTYCPAPVNYLSKVKLQSLHLLMEQQTCVAGCVEMEFLLADNILNCSCHLQAACKKCAAGVIVNKHLFLEMPCYLQWAHYRYLRTKFQDPPSFMSGNKIKVWEKH